MRRLALLLAASVLGTGCFVTNDTCNNRNVTVTWLDGFDGPAVSDVGLSCAAAGVAYVDLFLDGAPIQGPVAGHFYCVDGGATITGVRDGSQTMTVEGIASDLTILYRHDVPVNASGCGDFGVAAIPAAGTVDLRYAFQSGTTCAANPSYLWFSLFDVEANVAQPAYTVDANSSLRRFYTCPNDVVVALPAGQFRLDFMQEVVEPSLEAFQQAARACAIPTFAVSSRSLTTQDVTLYDNGVTCP